MVQSIIFDKKVFTLSRAKQWAKSHGYKSDVDVKEHTFRMRQREPTEFIENSFRIKGITNGIKFVFGHLSK